ncbi:MAG: DnaJ domain-containing protein [Pseudomonadota bacterium]
MSQTLDYYQILHVSEDAPQEIIRASYRALMQALRAHPDLGGDTEQATLINEAYSTLSRPERRRVYDEQRRGLGAPATAAPAPAPRVTVTYREQSRGVLTHCLFCGEASPAARDLSPHCRRCESPLVTDKAQIGSFSGSRAVDRLPKLQPLQFWLGWPGPTGAGETCDVSLHGMRFGTRQAPSTARGQLMKIDSALCSAVARVVRVDPVGVQQEVAVEFLCVRFRRALGGFLSTRA